MTGEKLLELLNTTTDSIGITANYYYNGRKPLDVFKIPLDTIDDLYIIPSKYRYKGMTVTVLSGTTSENGVVIPEEWWLVDGTKDSNWKKKSSFNGEGLSVLFTDNISGATIGLEYEGVEIGTPADVSEIVSAMYWETDGNFE